MATYGVDYYKTAKYTGTVSVEYGVSPFVAEPVSGSAVRLTWGQPTGNWTRMRLVTSRAGFPTHPADGVTLFDRTSADSQTTTWIASKVSGGWHYYTMFLYNPTASKWDKVGLADVLVPYDYSSVDLLWTNVPEYYRMVRDTTANFSRALAGTNESLYLTKDHTAENHTFSKFLAVFGWGLDILRSQIDSVLDGYNVKEVHHSRIRLLAEQFGMPVETSVPAGHNRSLVQNLGTLYRRRGRVAGLQDMLRLAVGWDVEITFGKNMMLDVDASQFTVTIPTWQEGRRYGIGTIVKYQGKYYRSLVVNINQVPPTFGTNNSYWNSTDFTESKMVRTEAFSPMTNEVGNWRRYSPTLVPASAQANATAAAVGVSDPADANKSTTALGITEEFVAFPASQTSFFVMGAPASTSPVTNPLSDAERLRVLQTAVPLPQRRQWDPLRVYDPNDTVLYRGLPYRAKKVTQSVPTTVSDWDVVGIDDKYWVTIFGYLHGPFSGAAGGGVPWVNPVLALYDPTGKNVFTFRGDTGTGSQLNGWYDPFITEGAMTPAGGRTLAVPSNGTWGNTTGGGSLGANWKVGRDAEGGYAYPGDATTITRTATGNSDTVGHTAITFRRVSPYSEIGVFFWRVDDNNWWAATDKGLYRWISGTRNTLATWPAGTFKDGDRIFVTHNAFNGSAGTLTVYKQVPLGNTATQLYTAASPAQTFATLRNGMVSWPI